MTTYRVSNDNLRQLLPSHLGTVLEWLRRTVGAASFPGELWSILPIRNWIPFVGIPCVLMNFNNAAVDVFSLLSCEILQQSYTTCQSITQPNGAFLDRVEPIKHFAQQTKCLCVHFSCWFCLVKLLSLHYVEIWSVITISYSRSCFKYPSHLKHKKQIPSNSVSVKHLYLTSFLLCIWNPDFFLLTAASYVVRRWL